MHICTNRVATAPEVAPAALLTLLAHTVIKGYDVVDIRPGFDSASCLASSAKSLVALNKPLNESRCRQLEDYVAANAHGANSVNFTCSNRDYFRVAGKSLLAAENTMPDADFYMWWSRLPFWSIGPILQTLRGAAARGHIRRTARALILFDMTQWRDAGIEQGMHANATWSTSVAAGLTQRTPSHCSAPTAFRVLLSLLSPPPLHSSR